MHRKGTPGEAIVLEGAFSAKCHYCSVLLRKECEDGEVRGWMVRFRLSQQGGKWSLGYRGRGWLECCETL